MGKLSRHYLRVPIAALAPAIFGFLGAERALAADAAATTPANWNWTGYYVGSHIGVAGGRSSWTATQPGGGPDIASTFSLFQPFNGFNGSGSQFAGLAGGYNYMFPSRLVVGVEADVSFPTTLGAIGGFGTPAVGAVTYGDTVEMFGTVRGRLGLDANHWLYYVTGGLAWTSEQFTRTAVNPGALGVQVPGTQETVFRERLGWTVGAGIEAPVGHGWSVKAEYLYAQYGNASASFPLGGQNITSDLATHEVRAGLNYKLFDNGSKSDNWPFGLSAFDSDGWAIHGQTTYVNQYAAPFHAPYRGANSLDSNAGRETWDATLYIGRKLWSGAELWIDPEIDQGFGLSNTLGIAGFTSGEAYKVGADYPYFRIPRMFVRQTIDLGGETQKVAGDINQFGGSQTANRLVITVGKFSPSDIFDTISYAHDPRNDFMNWTLVDAGTFDYAADSWGYSYGATAEWYQGHWALRAGLFDLSIVPNNERLDPTFDQFEIVTELEHRHELWGQPGKVAVIGFVNRGRMGRYNDAVLLADATGTTPSTADVRRYASRPGVNLNVEQQIVPNIGVFGRVGYADGNVEAYEFTDVDRTASLGASLNGKLWGREGDTIGIAGVVNEITSAHIAYLNAGGLGILIGDGQLPHPGPEQILETYYSLPIASWKATADYQFILNPGYNRDRGPVSVMSVRLHTQF